MPLRSVLRLLGHLSNCKVNFLSCISRLGSLSKGLQSRLFEIVAIKEVVSIKRDQPLCIGMDDVHTALLYRAHIEGVGIDELHNEHAEDILITQLHRSADGGHAAKQLTQTAGAR